eukprot:CAMPEP_0116924994 /NCGR_PEP_ID=MMETSP0467-20121206/23862_1 /TAXON_ID=283647 /ORGANISM="Mesodinium pulex, Strain SPMC105" /LENGTH=55 /DNA_ID=CAMNT_0004603969 /DNA_START=155 /DNA_END=322 /DNA_ORIENTATION=+
MRVAKEVDFACTNSGFFMVKGHGVSSAAIDDAFDVTKRFFDLPLETKKEVMTTED